MIGSMQGTLILFGMDLFKVNWYLVGYVLLSIVVTVMGFTRLNPMGTSRAVIFAIGAVLVFVFFGIRWFSNPTNTPKTWPPTINMCPDYLTFVPNLANAMSQSGGGCVDLLGVTNSASGIMKIKPKEIPTLNSSNTNKVFNYTSTDVKVTTDQERMQIICDQCQASGITWEGVYDGQVCTGMKIIQDLQGRSGGSGLLCIPT